MKRLPAALAILLLFGLVQGLAAEAETLDAVLAAGAPKACSDKNADL